MLTIQTCRSKEQLYHYITMLRFSAYDTALFLDTHPDDKEALCYFQKNNELLEEALKEYARLYGPLNMATVSSEDTCWEWIKQPWPWEGGCN